MYLRLVGGRISPSPADRIPFIAASITAASTTFSDQHAAAQAAVLSAIFKPQPQQAIPASGRRRQQVVCLRFVCEGRLLHLCRHLRSVSCGRSAAGVAQFLVRSTSLSLFFPCATKYLSRGNGPDLPHCRISCTGAGLVAAAASAAMHALIWPHAARFSALRPAPPSSALLRTALLGPPAWALLAHSAPRRYRLFSLPAASFHAPGWLASCTVAVVGPAALGPVAVGPTNRLFSPCHVAATQRSCERMLAAAAKLRSAAAPSAAAEARLRASLLHPYLRSFVSARGSWRLLFESSESGPPPLVRICIACTASPSRAQPI